MSVDPLIQGVGNSQGINPYSYIMNNPLSGTDPTGYAIEEKTKVHKVTVTGSRIKREVGTTTTTTVTDDSSGAVTSVTSATVMNNGNFSGVSVSMSNGSATSATRFEGSASKGTGNSQTVDLMSQSDIATIDPNSGNSGSGENRNPDSKSPPHLSMTLNDQDKTKLRLPNGDSADVFSGVGEHRNDPASTGETGKGPLPTGFYFIVDRQSGGTLGPLRDWLTGKDEWFSLYRFDGKVDDHTSVGSSNRSLFRMHPGSRSEGGVTFCKYDDFTNTRNFLRNSANSKIPGTNTSYYGTLLVD